MSVYRSTRGSRKIGRWSKRRFERTVEFLLILLLVSGFMDLIESIDCEINIQTVVIQCKRNSTITGPTVVALADSLGGD